MQIYTNIFSCATWKNAQKETRPPFSPSKKHFSSFSSTLARPLQIDGEHLADHSVRREQNNKQRRSMKKSVSVARAMKEKNRVALRLRIAEYRMKQNNSQCTRIPRTFDVQQAYNDTQVLRERLIETKAAIAKASNPITEKLIQLNEIKAEISFLKDVSTKEGDFPRETYRSADATFDTFTAIFTETQISEKVDQLQCQAEALQDELDEFNANTYVTIEVDW